MTEKMTMNSREARAYAMKHKKLPDDLTYVTGGLDLRGAWITALPEGLTVEGGLDLSHTSITALPDGLTKVMGRLDLSGTPITSLPDGLTEVLGWLDLSGTPIQSLPEGLSVHSWLDLRDTPITSLPAGLTVGKRLLLPAHRLDGLPDGVPAIPDIHRAVYAAASQPGALDMEKWHKCDTTHCRAGWVVTLANEAGAALEERYGTGAAAWMIYQASDPEMSIQPNWMASDKTALADMTKMAGA